MNQQKIGKLLRELRKEKRNDSRTARGTFSCFFKNRVSVGNGK